MPKPNREARRAAQREVRRVEAERNAGQHASIMQAFKQARERVAVLKAKTPRGLWPAAWIEEEGR